MIGPWAKAAPGVTKTAAAIPAKISLRMKSPSQLTRKSAFFGFPAVSSGSKLLSEQLDQSRIGGLASARMMVV
jgi:hypothetical protein